MSATSDEELAWTSWPARERPLAAVAGGVAILAFGVLGAMLGGHWVVGVATTSALIAFLHRFWFPVRCEIGKGQARVRTLLGSRTIDLSQIRRAAHDDRLLLLSTRALPSSADSLRGFLMPLPTRDGDALAAEVLRRLDRQGSCAKGAEAAWRT